eukprot:8625480-Heterocapsa_arctica.AAC.1
MAMGRGGPAEGGHPRGDGHPLKLRWLGRRPPAQAQWGPQKAQEGLERNRKVSKCLNPLAMNIMWVKCVDGDNRGKVATAINLGKCR